jgi:biotin carboxyl carrier protein
MTFEVAIENRVRIVAVEPIGPAGPDGGLFRVRLDGVEHQIDVRRVEHGLSLIYTGGRSLAVALTPRPAGEWLVQLPHVSVAAVVDGRRAEADARAAGGAGEWRLTAPMPGRIVRVLVQPGDRVTSRQGLVVVEAMKMENELRTPRDGVVREVAVREGLSVEAGRLLVVIE